jgi:hypothetical protein
MIPQGEAVGHAVGARVSAVFAAGPAIEGALLAITRYIPERA